MSNRVTAGWSRFGAGLFAAWLCAARGSRHAGAGVPAAGAPPPPPIHQTDDPILTQFHLALDRSGQHGRPHRRHRRRRKQSFDLSMSASPPAACGRRPTTARPSRRCSTSSRSSSIGDIAIAPSNPDILYVGTGEPNNRQSSSFGAGVYKSTDAGKTWKFDRAERDPEHRAHRRPSQGPRTSPMSRRSATCSDRIRSAASTRRPTAARPGRTPSSSITTPASPTWSWIRRIPTCSSPRPTSGAACRGASTAADRAAASGRPPTAGKTWTKLTGNGLPDNPIIGRIGLDIARSKPSDDLRVDRSRPERRHRRRRERRRHARAIRQRGAGGGGGGGGGGGAAALRRRRIRRSPASGDPTTPARRGDSCRTRWIGRCTTARSASTRPTPRSPTRAARRSSRPTDGGKTWRQVQGLAHSDHHAIWIDPRTATT